MAAKRRIVDDIAADVANVSQLATDAEIARLRSELASYRGRYKAALQQIDAERERADSIAGLSGIKSVRPALTKSVKGRKHQATVIVALSDWHTEELVREETVNGLNAFDVEICERRIGELSERFATLLEHERQLVKVDRVVVWLGGDFITGHIHEDCAELAQKAPLAAMRWAGERIQGFLDMVAGMAKEVIVVTSSGNHGRSNHGKIRVGTELDEPEAGIPVDWILQGERELKEESKTVWHDIRQLGDGLLANQETTPAEALLHQAIEVIREVSGK